MENLEARAVIPSRTDGERVACAGLHVRFGWWSLLVFLSLGMVLDAFHGLKVGWYLNADLEARRLVWTLAHAHGVLLSLVNVVFGLTLLVWPFGVRRASRASRFLLSATLLIPCGFLLGGIFVHGGDPGIAALLVPVGGVALFIGVLLVALASKAPAEPGVRRETREARSQKRPRR